MLDLPEGTRPGIMDNDICVCSLFRNSMKYLNSTYFPQVSHMWPLAQTNFIFVEGDSNDGTYNHLLEWSKGPYAKGVQVIKKNMGNRWFGSVVSTERFKVLAALGNAALDAVPPGMDFVIWLESDLILTPNTVEKLIRVSKRKFAVAPYIYVQNSNVFYDVWAFRKNGVNFSSGYPYHIDASERGPFKVDSAGSMLVIPARYIYGGARFNDNAIIGLCDDIKSGGGTIMADPLTEVYHPG